MFLNDQTDGVLQEVAEVPSVLDENILNILENSYIFILVIMGNIFLISLFVKLFIPCTKKLKRSVEMTHRTLASPSYSDNFQQTQPISGYLNYDPIELSYKLVFELIDEKTRDKQLTQKLKGLSQRKSKRSTSSLPVVFPAPSPPAPPPTPSSLMYLDSLELRK